MASPPTPPVGHKVHALPRKSSTQRAEDAIILLWSLLARESKSKGNRRHYYTRTREQSQEFCVLIPNSHR